MKQRYSVSSDLPPQFKKPGFRFEVIDRTHPSDGGPVAISWHKTRQDADATASALNLVDRL